MKIQTRSGNIYSYNKQTGEIVGGDISVQLPMWRFAPFVYFESLPKVDSFILGLTEQCNLRCTYCCYSGNYANKRLHSLMSMNCGDIDAVLDFISNNPNCVCKVSHLGKRENSSFCIISIASAGKSYRLYALFRKVSNNLLIQQFRIDDVTE